MRILKLVFTLSLPIVFVCADATAQWVKQSVDTKASLRGLSVVNEKVIWASGTGGTVIKTTDGGAAWKVMTVPGAEKLDFRDIEGFDENTAYILSVGTGEASRIYKTVDGGETWSLQLKASDKMFFDAIACWNSANCIAMSDPVNNKFVLFSTSTGGSSWRRINAVTQRDAKDGEAAFAASGTCLITNGRNTTFMVSGGSDARVFRSNDRGQTWKAAETPITKGTPGSGIFSIAMRDAKNGVIVGGNYERPDEAKNNLAFTRDGGRTWYEGQGLTGYRSAVTYIDDRTLIAVGTNGTDISYNRGASWKKIGGENLNAVVAKGKKAVWAVGPNGMVVKMK